MLVVLWLLEARILIVSWFVRGVVVLSHLCIPGQPLRDVGVNVWVWEIYRNDQMQSPPILMTSEKCQALRHCSTVWKEIYVKHTDTLSMAMRPVHPTLWSTTRCLVLKYSLQAVVNFGMDIFGCSFAAVVSWICNIPLQRFTKAKSGHILKTCIWKPTCFLYWVYNFISFITLLFSFLSVLKSCK